MATVPVTAAHQEVGGTLIITNSTIANNTASIATGTHAGGIEVNAYLST